MHLSIRTQVLLVSMLYVLLIGWDIWLYTFPEKTTAWHYLFNLGYGWLYLSGGIVAWLGATRRGITTNFKKALLFMGAAMIALFIGLVIWMFYNLVFAIAIPYPSLADTAFIFFTPLMVIGCIYLLTPFTPALTPAITRDFTTIIIFAFLVVFGFYSLPDLSTELPIAELFVNIAYPISDALLVALALMAVRVTGKTLYIGMVLLELGFILQAAADSLFSYFTHKGVYWNGDLSDLLFMTSAFFITLGIIYTVSSFGRETPSVAPIAPVPSSPSPDQQISA